MIQRIQSLYLAASTLLVSLLLFCPLATLTTAEGVAFKLRADSLVNAATGEAVGVCWTLFIVAIVMIVVPLATIFLFKRRMLQIRLAIFASILNALFYGLFFYEASQVEGASIGYGWVLVAPVLAIVCNILAIRKIGQDEMLIRSLNSNRLR
jgi:hypothetical protein